ncbi:MAG: hypothetical protein ACP5PN_04980 [Steroidobacteraceae bacterium]
MEWVKDGEDSLALIVRSEYHSDGVNFLTPASMTQQLAYMAHAAGHAIKPHVHNVVTRIVERTQEVLVIRKGKIRVDFYGRDRRYIDSRVLVAGDLIVLASGGHGFEILEDVEMYEIKQGPYIGETDKSRFVP